MGRLESKVYLYCISPVGFQIVSLPLKRTTRFKFINANILFKKISRVKHYIACNHEIKREKTNIPLEIVEFFVLVSLNICYFENCLVK